MKQPNILFVFSDQHRWCDLGCYGNMQIRTPHLDALASKGVRFENCISNSPVCVPARGTLLTGVYPLKHGAVTNDLPMRYGVQSMSDVLSANGYHTGYIGKWHLAGIPRDGYIEKGFGRFGFKEWKVCNCCHDYLNAFYDDEENRRIAVEGYEPEVQTGLAQEFIRKNKDINKSWFLMLSWGPPHDPYECVPQEYLDMYDGVDIVLRENVPEYTKVLLDKTISIEEVRQNHKGYYAHITALDKCMGRLVRELERTGQADNTIIVYTSDHGDMLGSQGFANKQLPYEESVKVPLIAYWKGHTLSKATDESIGLVDLPVSLLACAGFKFSGDVDGVDLHELFTEQDAKGREECYIFDYIPCHQSIGRGGTEWRGIRTRRYTFALTASQKGWVLFDNHTDPFQKKNLIDQSEYSMIRRELTEKLWQYISAHDRLLSWEDFIRYYGLKEEWNRSQAYFNMPLLE